MKKKLIFEGAATALITPFSDGKIDYPALDKIIERQIRAGIPALVIGGTTGEAATLGTAERYELFAHAKEVVRGRTKLIFGTGTNDTRLAVRHTEAAERIGCDGVLVVTPYYNKGTEEGIYAHYMKIADASCVPIILYNVPSRTGVNLSTELVCRLAEREAIVGIKEASDSQDRLVKLAAMSSTLALYAGNDSAIHTVLSLGGKGVISVVSNLYPEYVEGMCRDYIEGRGDLCLRKQLTMLPLVDAMFVQTNPTPVKYAMSTRGFCTSKMRLPLAEPSDMVKRVIDSAMLDFEIKRGILTT